MEFNIGTGVVKLFKCFVSSKKEDKGGGEEGFFFVGRVGSRSCFVLLCLSNLYLISETPFTDVIKIVSCAFLQLIFVFVFYIRPVCRASCGW